MKTRFKFIICSIFVGILCFGMSSVKAATITDFSNVSFEITGIGDSDHTTPTIKINGVEFMDESPQGSDLGYWMLIAHSSTEFEDVYNISNPFPSNGEVIGQTTSGDYIISRGNKYFEEAGDIYVTIYEQSGSTYTKATNAIKVERPPYLALSKRFTIYTFPEYSDVLLYDIGGMTTDRTVNYKIGKISPELIQTLKSNTTGGLGQLLTYAKQDNNANKSGAVELKFNTSEILSNSKIVENEYYYIYVELDDENGTYYPVEDVSIYQALKDGDGNLWLDDYTDSRFSWLLDDGTVSEKTVENPKTGIYYGDVVLALIIAMGSAIYFVTRKKSKFPQA